MQNLAEMITGTGGGSQQDSVQDTSGGSADSRQEMGGQVGGDNLELPGGFKSVDELANAYKGLDSLRGKLGSELGELRNQNAQLTGRLTELEKLEQRQAQAGNNQEDALQDIQRQLDDGDISVAEFVAKRDEIRDAEYNDKMASSLSQLKQEIISEADRAKYADRFISENPGYMEAFNAGALDGDMQQGMSAERAYERHQARELQGKVAAMEKQLSEKQSNAQKAGFEQGVVSEKGKKSAASVLGGNQGSFAGGAGNQGGPMTRADRTSRGVELLGRLRSGR